jgi:hypothetical protein
MANTTNQKVLIWALGRVGRNTGIGECWDLANGALTSAGAGTSADFGPTGANDDYIWGDEVPDLKDALPGDILQYRDYVQTTSTTTEVTFEDESGTRDTVAPSIEHLHHTAIVKASAGDGALTVLEQNHGGNKEPVKSTAIRWKNAATKTTETKKKMKRGDNGKIEMAKVTVTVNVTVTGTIKAFRPKAN